MAIHCDVCGTILMGGWENEGSFPTPEDFVSKSPYGKEKINNTCTPCGTTISLEIKNSVSNTVKKLRDKK